MMSPQRLIEKRNFRPVQDSSRKMEYEIVSFAAADALCQDCVASALFYRIPRGTDDAGHDYFFALMDRSDAVPEGRQYGFADQESLAAEFGFSNDIPYTSNAFGPLTEDQAEGCLQFLLGLSIVRALGYRTRTVADACEQAASAAELHEAELLLGFTVGQINALFAQPSKHGKDARIIAFKKPSVPAGP